MLAYKRLRPYLFLNHLESPDKEHLGIPYYENPGCLSQCNELPEIFSMHEGFNFFALIMPFNSSLNDNTVSIIIHFILLSCYIKAIYHIFYFK